MRLSELHTRLLHRRQMFAGQDEKQRSLCRREGQPLQALRNEAIMELAPIESGAA